ncbi:MAG: zinc ribbon domain-containing protein [bacterium]
MYCPNCGEKTTRRSKFCPNCGDDLTVQKSRKPKTVESRGVPLQYVIAILAAGILIGAVIIKYFDNGNETAPANTPTSFSIHSAAVLDIAREFNCPCGQCNHVLDECDCQHKNGAHEIKSFIALKLMEKHHKPHIIEMVQENYGGLRSQGTLPPDALKKLEEPLFEKNK